MIQKILIIEDESSIADTLIYALETEGFEPFWCKTGHDALEHMVQEDIALLIVDVGLPDMSGFDLCRIIRKESSVPIIFLTARAGEIDRVVGLELGADDYVVKPFSPRELTARVRAVLRRSLGENLVSGKVSDTHNPLFSLDESSKSITYCSEKLFLSRYEYKLLALFINNPGRVFSRSDLMDRVWEEPDSSLDRTVDTHIKTLRQKLRTINGEIDHIETKRGFGYAFREEE